MEFDVAFYEVFAEEEELLQEYLPQQYSYYFTKHSIQDDEHEELLAPVISVRTQSVIPGGWLDSLQGIFTRSTGYDHITMLLAHHEESIPAGYLPRYAARAVAEQNLMLMLMLLRKIDDQRSTMTSFSRDGITGHELQGKTLAIIGVGNIGSELAKIGSGLDMNLLGVDIAPKVEMTRKYDVEYTPLKSGLSRADIIACCLPLTQITEGMLDYQTFRDAQNHAVFINTARGEIAPPVDLLQLLEEDRLAGIGLDVYDEESSLGSFLRGNIELDDIESKAVLKSLRATLKLLNHPRVIATPHNAFNTVESTTRKAKQTAENIARFLDSGEFVTKIPD